MRQLLSPPPTKRFIWLTVIASSRSTLTSQTKEAHLQGVMANILFPTQFSSGSVLSLFQEESWHRHVPEAGDNGLSGENTTCPKWRRDVIRLSSAGIFLDNADVRKHIQAWDGMGCYLRPCSINYTQVHWRHLRQDPHRNQTVPTNQNKFNKAASHSGPRFNN